ncbi:MAG: hypothetical protein Q8R28_05840, partial [Dehalococcoidia bacterium]|nr:hypothetical protein [Dehalococcoidia bacterium]
ALYHRYSFNDPSIKSAVFTQPFSDGSQPTAKVQAVYQIVGQDWKVEPWTSFARKQFCFDKPEEKIDQLLIVISNSEYQNRGSVLMSNPQPELRVSSLGCTGWEGTAKVTETADSPGSVTAVASGQVRFELDPDLLDPNLPPRYYKTVSGQVNWTYSGALPPTCTISGSGSFPVGGWGSLEVWDDGGPQLRYHGTGIHPPELDPIKVTFTCDTGGWPITFQQFAPFNAWQTWFCACSPTEEYRADATGAAIKGSYTESMPGDTVKWEWDLHRE